MSNSILGLIYAEVSNRKRELLVKMVRWTCPIEGLKLNTDDDCSKGNPGGCGGSGILRYSNNKVILDFACFLGIGTSLEAEFKALLFGIRLCHAQGVKTFQLESDSLILVQILNGIKFCPWSLLYTYEEICKFRQHFLIVSYYYKQDNKLVDIFSNEGLNILDSQSFPNFAVLPKAVGGGVRLD